MTQQLITRAEFARRAGVTAGAITRASKTILKAATYGPRIDAAHPDAVKYIEEGAGVNIKKTDVGLDELFDEAAKWCKSQNRYSANAIKKQFGVGTARATRIFNMMALAELVPLKEEAVKPKKKPAAKPHVRGHAAKKAKAKKAAAAQDPKPEPRGVPPEPKATDNTPPPPNMIDKDIVPEDIRVFADLTLRTLIEKFGTDVRLNDWLKATKTIEEIADKRTKNSVARGELIERDFIAGQIFALLDVAFKRLVSEVPKTVAGEVVALAENGGDDVMIEVERTIRASNGDAIKATKAAILRRMKNK
jgi:hypothetical protein